MIGTLVLAAGIQAAIAADDDDRQFVESAKAYLTRNFNDPESARYRDLYIGTGPDGQPVLCGEVNARNGRGGMSGYLAFFSEPGADAKWARVPREFLERDRGGSIDPDYRLREGARCAKPGRPMPP